MFRTVSLSIIRSYSLYTQQWYMSYRSVDSFGAAIGSGWNSSSILILLLLECCLQTCMTYTIVVCTVNNSWWWTEELSEICRVSFQNEFEKLVHLVGFIIMIYLVKSSLILFASLPYYLPWIRSGTTITPHLIIRHDTLISILLIRCKKRATLDQTWYVNHTNYEVSFNKHTWLWRLHFVKIKLTMIYLQIATAAVPVM
jgi:hypothetical protein